MNLHIIKATCRAFNVDASFPHVGLCPPPHFEGFCLNLIVHKNSRRARSRPKFDFVQISPLGQGAILPKLRCRFRPCGSCVYHPFSIFTLADGYSTKNRLFVNSIDKSCVLHPQSKPCADLKAYGEVVS